MQTNLFLILEEAVAWMSAHPGAKLSLSSFNGSLVVLCQVADDSKRWLLTDLEVQKSFALDPTPEMGQQIDPKDRICAQLQATLVFPLSRNALGSILGDPTNEFTLAILRKASECRALLAEKGTLDPWPEVQVPTPSPPRSLRDLRPS